LDRGGRERRRLFPSPSLRNAETSSDHSNYRNEANGNWSSLLSVRNYLHGTVLLGVPQGAVEIGVPAYEREEDVTIGEILAMPFRRQREDWMGEDGPRLERPHDPSQRLELAE
jgi:hypothetical protein